MRFTCVQYEPDDNRVTPRTAYLVRDNWDDFGFKTTFSIFLVDEERTKHDLGSLHIMTAGMTEGRVEIPQTFNEPLPGNYCSLGNGQNYYETLYALPTDLREEYLTFIRDCVFNPEIWAQFENEEAMQTSLLRSVDASTVETTYRDILAGHAALTEYYFTYQAQGVGEDGRGGLEIDFEVSPGSMPPTNIHAVIGPNGVGKTRLFAGMTHALIGRDPDTRYPLLGEFTFEKDWRGRGGKFANLVTVTFSAFDSFLPVRGNGIEGNIRYSYVGLKKRLGEAEDAADNEPEADYAHAVRDVEFGIKTPDDLSEEFVDSLRKCLSEPRRTRWLDAFAVLSSDRGLRDLEVARVFLKASNDKICGYLREQFELLSSGHKIVVLTITRLVELVDDHTLVLIDEPESHLHPPLLGSFIRAVSELLIRRNGVGILATHSPVVLQEVPKNCVTVLARSGDAVGATRPEAETFAENVGVLTREAFGLEVTESGYHRMLASASQGAAYQDVLEQFGDDIGAEGRAIVRALISLRGED